MKINKLVTSYGVITNPSEHIAKMVIKSPFSAKTIINKPVAKSLQQVKDSGINLVPVSPGLNPKSSLTGLKINKLT